MDRVVARIGRAHGLRGEVTVEVRTDVPEQRFVAGAVFATDPVERGPLTLTAARDQSGMLVLAFEEVPDRSTAEALRGTLLIVVADASDEPDAWYEDELVGLRVEDTAGAPLGELVRLETGGAQYLLVVRPAISVALVRVPFVAALFPLVDVAGGRIVVDPPGGMFGHSDDEADDEGLDEGGDRP